MIYYYSKRYNNIHKGIQVIEMIRIAICEDVVSELETIRQMVEKIMADLVKNVEIFAFQSGEDLLCEIEATGNMDILSLDVAMNGMNGIETARAVRKFDNEAIIMFISNHDQYCKEMIEVWCVAFLNKPVDETKVRDKLKYIINVRYDHRENFSFKFNRVSYKIPLSEIRYFQSDRRIIHINTTGKGSLCKDYFYYGKMGEVEAALKEADIKFLRVRKSAIVNTQFIETYTAIKVITDINKGFPISRKYKKEVRKYHLAQMENE